MNQSILIEVTESDQINFKRFDLFVISKSKSISRTKLKELYNEGAIKGPHKISLNKMPPAGEYTIEIKVEENFQILPKEIPLDIIFEDEHLMFVNKPAGMVVHPGAAKETNTLLNAILYHIPQLQITEEDKRPGIVHRLDKGTSGLIVVAKTDECKIKLIEIFKKHRIIKKYEAIVRGVPHLKSGDIKSLIGRNPKSRQKMSVKVSVGKESHTKWEVINSFQEFSHMSLTLLTGRTHQIRVHLAQVLGMPILNDITYANMHQQRKHTPQNIKSLLEGYEHPLLHAKNLGFKHPITGEELFFEVSPPKIFNDILDQLKSSI